MFALGFGVHWYFFDRAIERPIVGVINNSPKGSLMRSVSTSTEETDFAQFWNTWAALDTYFAPASSTSAMPDSDAKVASAIAGLVASYQDPYTQFLPKVQADQLKESVRGDFQGIGAVLNEIPGEGILVADILSSSPADQSGMVPGDLIVAINGSSVVGIPFDKVVSSIRGEAGTEVSLSVLRESGTVEVKVTRAVVAIPTVAAKVVSRLEKVAASVKNGGAAILAGVTDIFTNEETEPVMEERSYRLVRLVSFSGSSVEQLKAEVEAFAKSDERAFILDLRDNPGGDLAVATEIASHFLEEGVIVSSVRDYKGNEEVYVSKGYDTLSKKDGCVAVVVNGNSASASEILAAALHEHGAAKSVGDKTFGKGSVQQLVEVGSLGTLKVTMAHWYTPNGHSISHQGFTPEYTPKEDAEATTGDIYLDTALSVCAE